MSLKTVILDNILNIDYAYFANLTLLKRFANMKHYRTAHIMQKYLNVFHLEILSSQG